MSGIYQPRANRIPDQTAEMAGAAATMPSSLDSTGSAHVRMEDGTVNREQLAMLRQYEGEAGASLLEELIDVFLGGLPQYLTEIRGAVASGNADRLRFAAHSLRGSCGTFGAMRLTAVCERLELLGRNFAREEACAMLPELEAAAARLTSALERERG